MPVIGIVASGHHFDKAEELFRMHNEQEPAYNMLEYRLRRMDYRKLDLDRVENEADVFIARGNTLDVLQHHITDKPVVAVPLLAADLLKVIQEASEKYGGRRLGIIAFGNMLINTRSFPDISGITVNTYAVTKVDDFEPLFRRALEDGCEVFAGGRILKELCDARGVPHVTIGTSSAAIWQAFSQAKQLLCTVEREKERIGKLQTVFDTSASGILTIDRNCVIDSANREALEILCRGNADIIGKHAEETGLPSLFIKVLLDGKEYRSEVLNLKEGSLAFRKRFIRVNGINVGAVMTFWRASEIEDLETDIRKKAVRKAFRARYTFRDIIGDAPSMIRAVSAAEKYARTNANILLNGRSGTGKEMFAQSIHNASLRSKGPFVAVNCAAVPEQLLESEFFGYTDGAFTGAVKGGKAGYFELAHNGTIFLDEISEMPVSMQAKLLRVLQERQVMRIGDSMVTPVNVRVISASNRSLPELVSRQKFRSDLLFRLDVLHINVPDLDDRKEDIPKIVAGYFQSRDPQGRISPEACEILKDRSWPGNVRELLNICERLYVMHGTNIIRKEDIPDALDIWSDDLFIRTEEKEEQEVIRGEADPARAIREALKKSGGSRSEAAKLLGIDRSTLWRKMKKMGIDR